jgi:polysaccharide pyruvyl transferase WcaK-like protein
MKIMIINHCSGNKGDRAVLYYLVRELNKYNVDSITISCSNPKLWQLKDLVSKSKLSIVPYGWDDNTENKTSKIGKRISWEKRRITRHIIYPLLAYSIVNNSLFKNVIKSFASKAFLEAIKKSDIIISTGGHHLTTRFSKNGINAMSLI